MLPSLPGMSVSAFARSLGVSRQTLHSVLAERSGVSAEMALRLGTLLGNGAQLWLDIQTKFDQWQTGFETTFPGRCRRSQSGAQSKKPSVVRGLVLPHDLLSRFEVFVLAG